MGSACCTQRSRADQRGGARPNGAYLLHRMHRAERCACNTLAACTSVQSIRGALHLTRLVNMKYGKYDFHKSSANISTSYSWYYRKNDNPTIVRKKNRLTRAASDSTLFSDYANQINMFEKEKNSKKCKKSASDVSKRTRLLCDLRIAKPVKIEPFTGNFYYGEPLPGFEFGENTDEKIEYLPDSEAVTPSEDTTAESLTTTAPTVVDIPELVRNPIYGCLDSEVHLLTPDSTESLMSKDSQLKSATCTELRKTMCSNKESNVMLEGILKDYKRIMKEWNNTVQDHYTSIPHTKKKGSTMCRSSNTNNYVRSLHSTFSCRKSASRCLKSLGSHYDYAYNHASRNCRKSKTNDCNKNKSLQRTGTFSNWTNTIKNLKKKANFWKMHETLTLSECECLEAIYEDYDRRLQDWCETVSSSSSTTTVFIKNTAEYLSFCH